MAKTIIGLESLERKMKRLERPNRTIARGMQNYFDDIQGDVEKYPPSSPANRPPTPYYVRGRGTQTSIGHNMGNSEKMSNKWSVKVRPFYRGVRGTMKNSASYSEFVVGKKQARFHKMRGWPQTHRIIEITKGKAVREIEKEIDKDLNRA